jgi:hypothetical protein
MVETLGVNTNLLKGPPWGHPLVAGSRDNDNLQEINLFISAAARVYLRRGKGCLSMASLRKQSKKI